MKIALIKTNKIHTQSNKFNKTLNFCSPIEPLQSPFRACFLQDHKKGPYRAYKILQTLCLGFNGMLASPDDQIKKLYSHTNREPSYPSHSNFDRAPIGLQQGTQNQAMFGFVPVFLLVFNGLLGFYIIPKWLIKVPGHIAIFFG